MYCPPFDRFLNEEELTEALEELVDTYPELLSMESIGRSHEGRPIWLITLAAGERVDERPAIWVDGNLHSTELIGSVACLYFIHKLVTRYEEDEELTHCLDTRTFYICPRVNPDGAELALAEAPRFLRSSTRPFPPEQPLPAGLEVKDINGDGKILTMRVPDPLGPWKISAQDPRLMIRRDPTDRVGQFYRLLPEGRLRDFDGFEIKRQQQHQNLDLNRNYPAHWHYDKQRVGSGPFATSEPEVRASVDFISRHHNICAGITFHSYGGLLLRPFSHKADDQLPAQDRRTYDHIAKVGTEMTGYPAVSAYHGFRDNPKDVITGALDDWLYEHRGIFAWTVELWSPHRQAGIEAQDHFAWFHEHPIADDLALLAWNDEALKGAGFVPWTSYEHPELGSIEIGGWDELHTFRNPPAA